MPLKGDRRRVSKRDLGMQGDVRAWLEAGGFGRFAELFESQQIGLRSLGNDWVSLHREYHERERTEQTLETSGTSELLMRNQYRAWAKFMTQNMKEA